MDKHKIHWLLMLLIVLLFYRVSELLAVVSVMSTFMLFIHSNHLQSQLDLYVSHIDQPIANNPHGQLLLR